MKDLGGETFITTYIGTNSILHTLFKVLWRITAMQKLHNVEMR